MRTVLDWPAEALATTALPRKPKIACLHPEVGADRSRAPGRFKLKVSYYETPRTFPPIRILSAPAPAATRENRTD